MGVEFQWQMDSEEAWETPSPRPERPRRNRWKTAGIVLAVVVVGLAIAVGRFWQQVRRGEENLKRDLKSVANLEAGALRDGDRVTFLWLQDQDDTTWYARQQERIPSLSSVPVLEPGQEVHLAVLEAALMPGGRAWAEVGWALDDGIYRRAQFYRQVGGHWLRTGVQHEYFGLEHTYETSHFAFKFLARDAPTVEWMARQLEAWYTSVCSDLNCDDPRRIDILLIPDGDVPRGYRPPHGFTVSSARLRGVREDGAPLPEERLELARILVYLLAARRASDVEATRQPYLLLEFVNWEMRRLGLAGEGTPPTPVLDYVMDSLGIDGVRALLEAMGRTNSEAEALRQALDEELPGQGDAFGQYLAAILAVERQMMAWQTGDLVGLTSAPLARQVFGSLLADESGSWRSEMYDAFRGWKPGYFFYALPPGRPVVERWDRLDDATIWAEVSYFGGIGARTFRRVEFFRQVDGAWRHTQPDQRFLGEEVALNSDHFRLVCHVREVESMVDELARLESLYRQIADAVQTQLPPGERLIIRITSGTSVSPARSHPGENEIRVSSPYFTGWWDDWGAEYLMGGVSQLLLARLAFQAAGIEELSAFDTPRQMWSDMILSVWRWKIVSSDTAQVVPWYGAMPEPLMSAIKANKLLSLSELGRVTFSSEVSTYNRESDDWELSYQEMAAMMNYVGEAYGQGAFVSLLRSLPEADSLEDWLRLGLDVTPESFEANWQGWLEEQATQLK